MPRYPDPLMNGTNPLLSLFEYCNTVTGSFFGTGLLLAIFIILWASMRIFGHRGTLTSLFITTVLAWIMRILGLIPEAISIFFTVGLIGMTLYYFLKGM